MRGRVVPTFTGVLNHPSNTPSVVVARQAACVLPRDMGESQLLVRWSWL